MTTDTFVNLDLLYHQLDKAFEALGTNVSMAMFWLEREKEHAAWLPEGAKWKINSSHEESHKALTEINKIKDILREFKKKGRRKSSLDITEGKPRLSHVNVIRGGLYESPIAKPKEDYLSDEFRAFLEKEKGCESSGSEMTN